MFHHRCRLAEEGQINLIIQEEKGNKAGYRKKYKFIIWEERDSEKTEAKEQMRLDESEKDLKGGVRVMEQKETGAEERGCSL